MRVFGYLGLAACLAAVPVRAEDTNLSRQIEIMQTQMRQMREDFQRVEQQQQEKIESLTRRLDEVSRGASTNAVVAATQATAPATALTNAPSAVSEPSTAEQLRELKEKVNSVVEAQTKDRPNEFNPSIGLVGETLFSYRSQGSESTGSERPGGFDAYLRSLELVAAASVDPYAKAYAVVNASADAKTGDAALAIEEAAVQTTSLPGNLEAKAGRFFGEFGKLSNIHDHELPFANRPMALEQYIGGESRTDGGQINWLLPIPHYMSLTLGAGNGFGGDSSLNNPGTFRHLGGFNYFGRLSSYFDLSPSFQLETGVSGLINPTTQSRGDAVEMADGAYTEKERRVGGADFKLSYVPLRNNQFQRVDWGSEVLFSDSRFDVSPTGDPLDPATFGKRVGSVGGYSYITYRWHRQWSGGFLFDYVQDALDHNDESFGYSPYLTWAISHWNQLRLQYTRTEHAGSSGLKPDDAVYLQWSWIIGAHSHGWQER